MTRNGGEDWIEVTESLAGLPEWGTVSAIEASPHDAETAYLVVDAHRLDDSRPYVWKTTDLGKSWRSLSAGLPEDVPLRAVREDPEVPGLLYLGGDRGVHWSPDGGASWRSLQLDLPPVPVADLVVHADAEGADLVLGTQGRSLYVLDDLTPIRRAARGRGVIRPTEMGASAFCRLRRRSAGRRRRSWGARRGPLRIRPGASW